MATISKTGIQDGLTSKAEHITRIIDALDGTATTEVVATGSFTGSLSGSFIGDITVQQAEFTDLIVRQTLNVGTENTDGGINIINSGSVQISGSINVTNGNAFTVEGVDVLDSALAFSIALG